MLVVLQAELARLVMQPDSAADPNLGNSSVSGNTDKVGDYASNWSERHVAYVCGLGTFGCQGLITSKGLAGRFGSIITD